MRKSSYTIDELKEAVSKSKSVYGTLRALKKKVGGGTHALLKLKIKQYGIDTSHFTGQGWCNGKLHQHMIDNFVKKPLAEILIKKSTYQNTLALKKRLIKEELLEDKCYKCGMSPIWNDEKLNLQLDHIDGDRCNNEISNLRMLCPNCHSQTKTYCGRNKKKIDLVGELADPIGSNPIA